MSGSVPVQGTQCRDTADGSSHLRPLFVKIERDFQHDQDVFLAKRLYQKSVWFG